ncbi:hypothetical protein Tco_0346113, partial [Tanacetum coccineum]
AKGSSNARDNVSRSFLIVMELQDKLGEDDKIPAEQLLLEMASSRAVAPLVSACTFHNSILQQNFILTLS